MSISNFGQLKTAVADWLGRGDLTAGQIADFITLATATLNKVLRDRRMVTVAPVTVTADLRYALAPADLLEPVMLTAGPHGTASPQLVTPEVLIKLRATRFTATSSKVRFYAMVGQRLEFCPTPSMSGTMDFAYYAEIPTLSADGDTNWVLTDEPDIYLYTALLHAAQYLHDPNMALQVRALLDTAVTAAVGMDQNATGAGA